MTTRELIILGMLAVVATVEVVTAVVPSLRRRSTVRWLGTQRLPLIPGLAETIERSRGRRALVQGVGILAGLTVSFVVLVADPHGLPTEVRAWLPVVATLVGITVGVGVHAFSALVRSADGPVRVAHGTAQTVTSFVSVVLLWVARGTFLVGAVSGVVAAAVPLPRTGGSPPPVGRPAVVVGVVILLGAWLAAEILAARLARRPQAAGSDTELAWRDALRAEQIWDLYALPTALALVVAALAGLQYASGGAGLAWVTPLHNGQLAVVGLLLLGMIAQGVLTTIRPAPPARRRRAQLQSGTAAGSR